MPWGGKEGLYAKPPGNSQGAPPFSQGALLWSETGVELGCFPHTLPRCSLRLPSSVTQEDPVFTIKLGSIRVELLQSLF